MATVRLNDIGTIFRSTIKESGVAVDISAATTLTMRFRKPSGTTVNQTAVFTIDGVNGQLEYVIVSGDLDEVGVWLRQPFVDLPGSPAWSGHGEETTFEVERLV